MKKFNILFICFIVLYSGAGIYLDLYLRLRSAYWLAGQLLGLLVITSGLVYSSYQSNHRSRKSMFILAVFWSLWGGYYAYRAITRYEQGACQEKFGKEFNHRRQQMGEPVIPADWHIDFWDKYETEWSKKDSSGHFSKRSEVDSLCALESEEDEYNLKLTHGVKRSMFIQIWFDNKKHTDTIKYHYDVGDSSRTITRQQADSIFAAEKIQKDY